MGSIESSELKAYYYLRAFKQNDLLQTIPTSSTLLPLASTRLRL